ncbi:MAG TPA: NAD(P)-dependent oxidoreductase [Acidimicrobiales bacterium]|nr:NAD(P)-dependent oxidoreductase [Acidimicrobiales bacterium]
MDEIVLVTGAQGTIGSMLRRSLRRAGRHLRLLDVAPLSPLEPGEDAELIAGSFLDPGVLDEACRDARAIVHLGGLSHEGYSWAEYLEVNIHGTFLLAEAARSAGVQRIVYASSNHAVGFAPLSDERPVPDYEFPRPDTFYGVSKAASESLLSLYHDRYGLDVVCLRIGSYRERPSDARSLWSWLSPADCARLVNASLDAAHPGFRIVWGVSANSAAAVSLDEARAIGYEPRDNAQDYAAGLSTAHDHWANVGGRYTGPDVT